MKNSIKLILILLIIEVSLLSANSSNWKGRVKKDFDIFITHLIQIHPDPYCGFENQQEFLKSVKALKREVAKVKDQTSFAIKLNSFLSNLKDEHSYIIVPGENYSKFKKFPLKLKISENSIFVQNSTKNYRHLKGMRINRVDGIPIEELTKKTSYFLPSENLYGKMRNFIRTLNSNRYHKYIFQNTDSLSLDFTDHKKEISETISYEKNPVYIKETSPIKTEPSKGLIYSALIGNKKDIGYFRWDSIVSREHLESLKNSNLKQIKRNLNWVYKYMKVAQSKSVEKSISQIPSIYQEFYKLLKKMETKKASTLIIDLRYNSGGMTPLTYPLLYILQGDRYLQKDFKASYIQKLSPQYLSSRGFKDLATYNRIYKSSYKAGDFIYNRNFGNFWGDLPIDRKRAIAEKAYQGYGAQYVKRSVALTKPQKIVVLTSPGTFSAAYHFTYFLKKMGNTIIVGVPSRQKGNCFMGSTRFRLPNTSLYGSISNSSQQLYKEDSPNRDILKPDYIMRWTDYSEYRFNTDAEVLKAIELIENFK